MTENTNHGADVVVGEFPKNSREVVRVVNGSFRGVDLTHVRTWVRAADSDELRPTKSGIAIRRELVPKLIDLLQAVVAGGKA